MKIAICKSPDPDVWGFGLSTEAVKRIAELQNCKVYCYYNTNSRNEYKKIKDYYGDDGFVYYMTEDAGDITDELKGNLFTPFVSRNDPILIQVIEELGKKSFACYSNIQIVEIPDGSNYIIEKNIDANDNYIETIHIEN